MTDWKFTDSERQRIHELSNAELLKETMLASRGDDYDGCFTPDGRDEYNFLTDVLHERLTDWLTK